MRSGETHFLTAPTTLKVKDGEQTRAVVAPLLLTYKVYGVASSKLSKNSREMLPVPSTGVALTPTQETPSVSPREETNTIVRNLTAYVFAGENSKVSGST